MSSPNKSKQTSVSRQDLFRAKQESKKFSVVTCYDAAFAKLISTTNIDMVLVGDSVGNVVLGYEDTLRVTIDDMIHHTAAVSRTLSGPMLVADMPFMSYHLSKKQALKNAGRLVQEGGAHAVKLEGGVEICNKVDAIVKAGIPVIGHLGLTPQSVHALSGYKVQGKSPAGRQRLKDDALKLQDAGATAVVLELVPASLAAEITAQLEIPTIGIGAGPDCDAQVLVLHDLLGFDDSFSPKFLKRYAGLGQIISSALKEFDSDVKMNRFPTKENSFSD